MTCDTRPASGVSRLALDALVREAKPTRSQELAALHEPDETVGREPLAVERQRYVADEVGLGDLTEGPERTGPVGLNGDGKPFLTETAAFEVDVINSA